MATHHNGTDKERTALDAFIKLLRCADSVSARVNAHLAEQGLTATQFGALEAIYHLGPMCQRTLSEKLLKSGGNVTLVVDNLEKRGLAKRQRDAQDRRLSTVHLTDAGGELIARLFPEHVQIVVNEFSVLEAGEQEALGHLCRRLGRKASGQPAPESKSTQDDKNCSNR